MRPVILLPVLLGLSLASCGKGGGQAAALDHAADQADPTAAAAMHNEADAIRSGGTDSNLSDPNSPAQAALANAGAAAAGTPEGAPKDTSPGVKELVAPGPGPSDKGPVGADQSGATPHRAGQPVPNSGKAH